MQSKWFSHLSDKQQVEEFKARVRAAAPVLERLNEIMSGKAESHTSVSSSDYDSPSWAYKQAHSNGYCEALRELTKYLDTTES